MNRFIHPALTDLDPEQQGLYDDITTGPRAVDPPFPLTDAAGHLQGPFGPMVDAGALGAAVAALGESLRFRSRLSDREREIAVLATASHMGSTFEQYAHERVAHRLHMTDAEIEALRHVDRRAAMVFADRREAMVLDTTANVLRDGSLTDREFDACRQLLSQAELFELLVLIGHYRSLATAMNVFGIEAPDTTPDA